MNIDDLARSATTELLERTSPPADVLLPELRRTRRRRSAERVGLVVLALVLATVGSAVLLRGPDRSTEPVDRPDRVSNGAIVVRAGAGNGYLRTANGTLEHLPSDAENFSSIAFTADGSEIVYANRRREMAAVNVDTGVTRILGDCTWFACDGALSPDGRLLATGARNGLRIHTVGSDRTVLLPTPGTEGSGFPRWSPDGRRIAFLSGGGLSVMDADGGAARQLHPGGTYPEDSLVYPQLAWSPDGRTLAFLLATPRSAGDPPDYDFTVMTVGADGTGLSEVHDAGHCVCLGLPSPALTWSPDGERLAVALAKRKGGPGVFVVAPDGSGWERLASGVYGGAIAWQPLPG